MNNKDPLYTGPFCMECGAVITELQDRTFDCLCPGCWTELHPPPARKVKPKKVKSVWPPRGSDDRV